MDASTGDGSAERRRAHARFMAALVSAGAVALAAGLVSLPAAESGTTPLTIAGMAGLGLLLASAALFSGASLSGAPAWGLRSLMAIGSLCAIVALVSVLTVVGVRVLAPAPQQSVSVQFIDLSGRVQLEYCPSLPGSFTARASATDLRATSAVLPVKVTGQVCGNPAFTHGVWLYLNRSSITVAITGSP